jgi:hypothetical protein
MFCSHCFVSKIHTKAQRNRSDNYLSIGNDSIVIAQERVSLLRETAVCYESECPFLNRNIYRTRLYTYFVDEHRTSLGTTYLFSIYSVARKIPDRVMKNLVKKGLKEEARILYERSVVEGGKPSPLLFQPINIVRKPFGHNRMFVTTDTSFSNTIKIKDVPILSTEEAIMDMEKALSYITTHAEKAYEAYRYLRERHNFPPNGTLEAALLTLKI